MQTPEFVEALDFWLQHLPYNEALSCAFNTAADHYQGIYGIVEGALQHIMVPAAVKKAA